MLAGRLRYTWVRKGEYMKFKEFAQLLFPIIGAGSSTHAFVRDRAAFGAIEQNGKSWTNLQLNGIIDSVAGEERIEQKRRRIGKVLEIQS